MGGGSYSKIRSVSPLSSCCRKNSSKIKCRTLMVGSPEPFSQASNRSLKTKQGDCGFQQNGARRIVPIQLCHDKSGQQGHPQHVTIICCCCARFAPEYFLQMCTRGMPRTWFTNTLLKPRDTHSFQARCPLARKARGEDQDQM